MGVGISRLALLISLALSSGLQAWGQVSATADPGAVEQHSSGTKTYYDIQNQIQKGEQKPEPFSLTNHLAPQPASRNSIQQPHFVLKNIVTNPSSILTSGDIHAIVSPYEGKQVSFVDLGAIVTSINRLYQSRGYITATAVLPPQTISDGVVQIQLIESRLGKVVIKDTQHTRRSYINRRIPIKPGDLLQIAPLEQALNQFNQTNDIKLRAVLQAGQDFGTTDLVLAIPPTTFQSTSFSFDDSGLASTGRNHLGISENISSLFGYRDPLSVGGSWAGGMLAGFASYDFPLTAGGLRLGPVFSYNKIKIHQSQLQPLGVNGSFYDISLRLSHPYVIRNRFSITGYVAPHYQDSTLKSQSFQISNTPIRFLEIGAEAQAPDSRGFWSANLTLSGGDYSALGVNQFMKFDASLARYLSLPHGFNLLFRTQGQGKAGDPRGLPPSLQFQVGGVATVRGYPEGAIISDEGYALSAELDTPAPLGERKLFGVPLKQRFRIAWFIDHGGVLSPSPTLLSGTGAGVIVNLPRSLQGRVYVATPLELRSSYSGVAVHFSISADPSIPHLFRKAAQ
jgi:hemolysin activation/secretion protein